MFLPDCRLTNPKGIVLGRNGNHWVPIFCANCGNPGGAVPEENMTFAFYLCDKCVEAWGPIANMLMVPDEAFWSEVAAEQEARRKQKEGR